MTELERLLNGLEYNRFDKEVSEFGKKAKMLCYKLNMLPPDENDKKEEVLTELLGNKGHAHILSNFQCDYGKNIFFDGFALVNHNCVMLDTARIKIGAGAFIGPGTIFACPSHAIDPTDRLNGLGSDGPITLGTRVWIGANVTILGNVTIGNDTIIGAGGVVTKDIPSGVIAVGNPCRVLRTITEEDKINYKISEE